MASSVFRFPFRHVICASASLLTLFALGCSEPTPTDGDPTDETPPTQFTPAIVNTSAHDSTTGIVRSASDISVRVTGADGRPLANSVVVFSVMPEGFNDTTATRLSTNTVYANFASATTGSDGIASAHVLLSRHAGNTMVRAISVPLQKEAAFVFTAIAGAAVTVAVSPADTVLIPGQSVTFSGQAFDQYGNARNDTIAFTSKSAGATVTTDGHATAQTLGLHAIAATVVSSGGGGKGAAGEGRIWAPATQLAFTPVSGSVRTPVIGTPNATGVNIPFASSSIFNAAWQPGQQRLAFVQDGKLMVREPSGSQREIVTGATANANTIEWPEFSPDGQYIYFSALDAAGISRVYRIRLDGTGFTLITPNDTANAPTLSPDGNRVAFRSNKLIKIIDVRTGAVAPFASVSANGGAVDAPRWSPNGQMIAFWGGGGINAFRVSDGTPISGLTGTTTFGVLATGWSAGFTWSQDSQFLLGYKSGTLTSSLGVGSTIAIHIGTSRLYRLPAVGQYPAIPR